MSWTCVLLFCWTCYMLYLIAIATGPAGYTVAITLGFIVWNMRYIYFFYVTSLFHAELDQENIQTAKIVWNFNFDSGQNYFDMTQL